MRERHSDSMTAVLALASLVLGAGCTDPAIELSLRLPADSAQYDTSCVSAVELRVMGRGYAQDSTDYQRACIELPSAARTYPELRSMMRGKFTFAIPETGVGDVAMRGLAGASPCQKSDETDPDYAKNDTPDLVFHAAGTYGGDDAIALDAVPNLQCGATSIKVRVVDMLALVASGSSASCATAMTYADHKGWGATGTIVPRLHRKGVDFYGGGSWAAGTNSVAQFTAMTRLAAGHTSCLALASANETGANTTCLAGGASVCAATGELETAAISYGVWPQVDRALQGQFPSVLFGSVWNSASPKTPIGGATVAVDPARGKVVYIDPPDATGTIHARSDQGSTGPSGLFVLYTDAVVTATISAARRTRTVVLGSPDYTMGGTMVVLP